MGDSIIHQKIKELFEKHNMDGQTPRKLLESNMARELRFSRENIHQLLEEMKLLQEENLKRKKVKREERVEYNREIQDQYTSELRAFR